MSYEAKPVFFLLILVVSFAYGTFALDKYDQNIFTAPQALGKVINRLIFDTSQPYNEIIFVGDVLLARDVERRLSVVGQDYPFLNMAEYFDHKYVVGNFEAAIPKIHKPTPDLNTQFSVKTDSLDTIVKAKFTHFSLANNHTNDFGEVGFSETVKQLELRGFKVFGVYDGVATTSVSEIVVNKKKVALIAINTVTSMPDLTELKNLIQTVKNTNDYVVIYPHWGDEYQETHNQQQESLAHQMIDNGADIIIGSHPHVVQDMELYKNRLIVYSLGNFLFDQYFSPEVQTGLTIRLLPENDKMTISLLPVSSINTKIQPQFLVDRDLQLFLENLAKRSTSELESSILNGKIELNF